MTVPRDDPILLVLEEEFARLKGGPEPAREPRKEKKVMLPTQKTPPKMSLSGLTVLVHGAAKLGKCLSGDALILDPVTARPVAIRDLVAAQSASVLTLRDGGVIAPQRPSAYLANEPAQLYRLTTQTGRTIEATANHPFLTRDGWKPLSELGPSDRVAVVAEYPSLFGQTRTDKALGSILFDRIVSVEPTEIAPVYDLTIDGSHNFIANDFVVHNSTLCSQAPGALFLATEAGLNALDVYQVPVRDWNEFMEACRDIGKGEHDFKTIVVDTLDNAFRMCSEHICRKHKIEHESDLAYGKGFSLVNGEFHRVLNKLSLLPYGLFLISHSQEKEIETRAGKRTRIVPTLPEKARQMVLGMADIILYCDVDTVLDASGKPTGEHRVMRTKPNENYEAGDRTGRLPEVLPLDYAAFAEAFERAVPTAPPRPPAPQAGTAKGSEAPPEEKQYATDAQVAEFEELVKELKLSPEAVAKRLAHFGVVETYGLMRKDMEAILARLRAAKEKRKPAKAPEPGVGAQE